MGPPISRADYKGKQSEFPHYEQRHYSEVSDDFVCVDGILSIKAKNTFAAYANHSVFHVVGLPLQQASFAS